MPLKWTDEENEVFWSDKRIKKLLYKGIKELSEKMSNKIKAEYVGAGNFHFAGKQVCFAKSGDEIEFEFENHKAFFKFDRSEPKIVGTQIDIEATVKLAKISELKLVAGKLCPHCRSMYKNAPIACSGGYFHGHTVCMGLQPYTYCQPIRDHQRTCMAGKIWERIWELERTK